MEILVARGATISAEHTCLTRVHYSGTPVVEPLPEQPHVSAAESDAQRSFLICPGNPLSLLGRDKQLPCTDCTPDGFFPTVPDNKALQACPVFAIC